jgi:predicted RecA/RadA family phage recombinase
MAKNFVKPGKTITLVAPTGGVTVGLGYIIGAIFVVALQTALATVSFEGSTEGVWDLAKVSTENWIAGDKVYWDSAAAKATSVAAGNRLIGAAAAAAANTTTTGNVRLDGTISRLTPDSQVGLPISKNTAGAVTLTAAEVLSGLVVADPNGAARTYTLPTAALLVAAMPGARVGDVVRCYVINGADAAETLTLAAGAGGAFDANQTASSQVIPQNASKMVHIRITNIGAATEAYVVYA